MVFCSKLMVRLKLFISKVFGFIAGYLGALFFLHIITFQRQIEVGEGDNMSVRELDQVL